MRILRYVATSFTLATGIFILLLLSTQRVTAGGIGGQEADLTAGGAPYEINSDWNGDLWISDAGVNQVWQVNPATSVYTLYQNLPNACDARMDASGVVWWSDWRDNALGRLSPVDGSANTWVLSSTGSIWGIAFDDVGRVWSTDYTAGQVYALMPGKGTQNQLCDYPMPDGGMSDYIVWNGGAFWLGDRRNHRIVKLDPTANEFTYWPLRAYAWQQGMAIDAAGDLWWADEKLNELGRFDETSSSLYEYTLPVGAWPEMVSPGDGQIWYTEKVSGSVGALDPAQVIGTPWTLISTTVPVSPVCTNLGPGSHVNTLVTNGSLAWSTASYTLTLNGGGWTAYQLPAGTYPWGVTVQGNRALAVDQGRQKLDQIPVLRPRVYIPVMTY